MIEVKIILTSIVAFLFGIFIIEPLDNSGHKAAVGVVAYIAALALAATLFL